MKPKQLLPSRKWYGLSILIFLLGPLISAYLLYSVFSAAIHTITFYVPGISKIYIMQPGEYTLWVTSKNPQAANKLIMDLQSTRISVTNLQTQQSFNMIPKLGWSDQQTRTAHFSLGVMRFDRSGFYQVTATGQGSLPYKVYLRQPTLLRVLGNLALSIFLTVLSVITGVLSAIIILIKRIHARNIMEKNDPKTIEETPSVTPQSPTQEATTWAMVVHLSGFIGFLFPLANVIAPLLIWGFKRQKSAYIDDQGKEAVNFQISITIYYIVSALLILIIIGLFLLPLIAAFQIIAMIIASIESANGKPFRYPLTIRFLR